IAKIDLDFHLAIARMSGNPFMRSASAIIEAALAISFQLSSPAASPEKIEEVATNHLRTVHAIAAREPDTPVPAMGQAAEVGTSPTAASLAAAAPNAAGANATGPRQPSGEPPAG